MTYPYISDIDRLKRLTLPTEKIRIVLDTDTYNEIDDQFALVYSLLSPEKIDLEAVYAAPFLNKRSTGPGDGMEKSYEEILRLLDRLKISPDNFVFKGSTRFLESIQTPCPSNAVSDLIERALKPSDKPLYVVAIGAITNIASAILIEPKIIDKIVVVWLGGHALHWSDTKEFNLKQDLEGSRVLFDCGVPLVHIPCLGVTSHLLTTVPEITAYVKGKGEIGDYLHKIFCEFSKDSFAWSKVIWDIAAIAYLLDESWVPTHVVNSPIISDQFTWSFDKTRHLIKSAYMVNRDAIFKDLFMKLSLYSKF